MSWCLIAWCLVVPLAVALGFGWGWVVHRDCAAVRRLMEE